MRKKLNENPVAQIALLGVLALVVGYLVISNLGGGGSGEESSTAEAPTTGEAAPSEAPAETVTTSEAAGVSGEAVGTAPQIAADTASTPAPASHPLPPAVEKAYRNNKIVVLVEPDAAHCRSQRHRPLRQRRGTAR